MVFPSGEVEIDFMARTFRNTTPFALDDGASRLQRHVDGGHEIRAMNAQLQPAARDARNIQQIVDQSCEVDRLALENGDNRLRFRIRRQ